MLDHLLRLLLERGDVRRCRVVHVVASDVQLRLEPVVARIPVVAVAAQDLHLVVDRIADAVEDDVQDRLRPQRQAPILRLRVVDRTRVLARSHRHDEDLVVVRMQVLRLHVGAERRIVRVDAAVDEAAVRRGRLELLGLEERRRRRGRPRDEPHGEVVARVLLRLVPREEPRLPRLELVAGHERLRQRLAQHCVAEVVLQYTLDAGRVVLLVDEVVERDDRVPERAVEDARALLVVEGGEIRRRVLRLAVLAGLDEPEREDATRRGARNQVEQLRDPRVRALFDRAEDHRGDDAAYAAAVDRENLEDVCHGALLPLGLEPDGAAGVRTAPRLKLRRRPAIVKPKREPCLRPDAEARERSRR